ncbi:MAG: hypothetical protein Q7T82_14475 [Armatimonadota bacterium]|nr:hypothetical protein [Armatimonadota bacterium]
MRAMTLIFVLALAAMLAMPVFAEGYGSSSPAEGAMESATPAPTAAAAPACPPGQTPAAAVTTTTTTTMTSVEYDPLVTATIVRTYALDPATVSQLQARGYTNTDLAVLGNLSVRTGKPVSELVALRDRGMSWSDIASRYNIARADLMMPMVAMMAPEVDAYSRQFARQYFGLSDTEITALRAQGMGWGEVFMTANLALRTNQSVSQIASLRSQGFTWTEIGSRYNVTVADISMPFVPPGRVAGVTVEVSPVSRPLPIVNRNGQIVLTEQDARFFEKSGYTWRDIAIAANISKRTGTPVHDLLRMRDNGRTWSQISRDMGLNADDMMDVSDYPFRGAR